MKPAFNHIAIAVLFVFMAFLYWGQRQQTEGPTKKETAFERVLRTGVIRCGYYIFPPVLSLDLDTGKFYGFSVDFMERMTSQMGLKVEWTEEVTFANWIPALQSKRFDAVCTPMWPDLPMYKAVSFTDPMFYSGLSPLVRTSDTRFENDLNRVNQPDVTILTQEGNMTDRVSRDAFPRAKFYTLSANVEGSQYFQDVISKKADAVLTDRNGLYQFGKENGAVLRLVAPDQPVKLQSFPLVVGLGELLLKDLFDQAIREMNNNGDIDRMLRKWEPEPGKTYLRVMRPFVAAEK
ncbi:MAG: substrate-binding periplasmic protein [Bdellovibrionales bacterium]